MVNFSSFRAAAYNINGYTLIELLVVITILVVMVTATAPAFTDTVKNAQLISEMAKFESAILLGKSTAMTHKNRVVLCPSPAGTLCDGTDWSGGWILLEESPGGDQLLMRSESSDKLTISLSGFTNANQMVFTLDGTIMGVNDGRVTICDERGANHAEFLLVNANGFTRKGGLNGANCAS